MQHKVINPATPSNLIFISIYQFGVGEHQYSACFVLDSHGVIQDENAKRADCHLFWQSKQTKERIFIATPYLYNQHGYYPQHNQLLQTLGLVTVGNLELVLENDGERFLKHFQDKENFFQFLFQNYHFGDTHRYLFCEFGKDNPQALSTQVLNQLDHLDIATLQDTLSVVSQFSYDPRDLIPIALIETAQITHTDCSHRLLKNSQCVAEQGNFLGDLLYTTLCDSICPITEPKTLYPAFLYLVQKEQYLSHIPHQKNELASPKLLPSMQFLLKHWLNPHNQSLDCYTQTSQYPAITQNTTALADPFYNISNAKLIHENHSIQLAFGVFDKLLSHKFMSFANQEFVLSPSVFLSERLPQFEITIRFVLIINNLTSQDKGNLRKELALLKSCYEQLYTQTLNLTIYEYQNELATWIVMGYLSPLSQQNKQDQNTPPKKSLSTYKNPLTPLILPNVLSRVARTFYQHLEPELYLCFKSSQPPIINPSLVQLPPPPLAQQEVQQKRSSQEVQPSSTDPTNNPSNVNITNKPSLDTTGASESPTTANTPTNTPSETPNAQNQADNSQEMPSSHAGEPKNPDNQPSQDDQQGEQQQDKQGNQGNTSSSSSSSGGVSNTHVPQATQSNVASNQSSQSTTATTATNDTKHTNTADNSTDNQQSDNDDHKTEVKSDFTKLENDPQKDLMAKAHQSLNQSLKKQARAEKQAYHENKFAHANEPTEQDFSETDLDDITLTSKESETTATVPF